MIKLVSMSKSGLEPSMEWPMSAEIGREAAGKKQGYAGKKLEEGG